MDLFKFNRFKGLWSTLSVWLNKLPRKDEHLKTEREYTFLCYVLGLETFNKVIKIVWKKI